MRRARLAMLGFVLALSLAACGGNPTGEPVRFTVPPGSGMSTVVDTLAARGIIEWPAFFRVYARLNDAARAIKPGTYELRAGTAWSEIIEKLVSGDVIRLTLVIPEGWTAAQIADRIAPIVHLPADSVRRYLLSEAAASGMGVPGPTLEGYLYPATYEFPDRMPMEDLVRTLVRRYQQVWTPELRAQADSLGMSERDVVALATIFEK